MKGPATDTSSASATDLSALRDRFPALAEAGPDGRPFAFFDGPAGTQVPQAVIDAMATYFRRANANTHGWFETSRRSQETVDAARRALADLLNARPDEIVFGPNMTTLTFATSRALGRRWGAGDEVVVTRLDHDANIAPWVALAERGVVVRQVGFHREDCTLDLDELAAAIGPRTRLVAVGLASNVVGTINPVARIARLAHAAGAAIWVDAVHAAPHVAIDVAALDIDYLVCSAYKFYGPHVGVLWGRRELLAEMTPYKVRPAPPDPPEKLETGTPCFEGLAGLAAAIDYLAAIGRTAGGGGGGGQDAAGGGDRRHDLRRAYDAIAAWERELARRLLAGLAAIPGARVFGITDPARLAERCPTIAFRLGDMPPATVAARLGEQGICVWDGNQYALALTEHLGIERLGGVVRAGIVHTTTPAEVDRLLAAIAALAGAC